ncbi:hypothetical protein GDO81_019624 [Engystomops pustulosus]|uniref:Uncharacterized protein n=1 Tax=Engystomops pustulosus TaxID=76066 RepID=A0AAV6ZKB5_ENGPU|nr:hypothetical protein GDO81_019624 [Engystomops pustulosus]
MLVPASTNLIIRTNSLINLPEGEATASRDLEDNDKQKLQNFIEKLFLNNKFAFITGEGCLMCGPGRGHGSKFSLWDLVTPATDRKRV